MSDVEKKFLEKQGFRPRISFKKEPKHKVKILNRRERELEFEGEKKQGIEYLCEEDNEQKTFFTASLKLIAELSDYKNGVEIIIEMKSRKGENGKWVSYFVVTDPNKEISQDDNEPPVDAYEDKTEAVEVDQAPF